MGRLLALFIALSLAMGCLLALFNFPFLGHGMFAVFVAMGCLLALFFNLSLAMGCLLSLIICPCLGHRMFAVFVHLPSPWPWDVCLLCSLPFPWPWDVCWLCSISLSLAMGCLLSLITCPFLGYGMFAVFVYLPFPWPWDVCWLCSFSFPWPWDVCCLCSFYPFLIHVMFAVYVFFFSFLIHCPVCL